MSTFNRETARLKRWIFVLRRVQRFYPGKNIDNIIQQLDAVLRERERQAKERSAAEVLTFLRKKFRYNVRNFVILHTEGRRITLAIFTVTSSSSFCLLAAIATLRRHES